jgi:dTDP-4-amino-4,6-dideoxy-D-glucose/dTDP-4-amino-2,4-dideoxy-beta-L-xylose transaminase
MIPLYKVPVPDAAAAQLSEVLASGFLGQGPRVDEFERRLSAHFDGARVATVGTATAGVYTALRVLLSGDAERGDPLAPGCAAGGEVLTSPLTFEAANWAVLANRLTPRWVDVDPATFNVDLDDLAAKITPATRAVLVVHWAGYPVDLDRLTRVVARAEAEYGHRIAVIEDCAHAWGATYRGRRVGLHGHVSVFSFHALKHVTCGDGGALVLPDAEWERRTRLQRFFGIDRTADRSSGAYDVEHWGLKSHMNDVSAAIGLASLDGADARVERARANAAHYDRELAGVPGIELGERAPDREGSYWIYMLKAEDRPGLLRRLGERDIGAAALVSRRNDAHSCVSAFRAALPGLDAVYGRMVALPVGWWVTDEDRAGIVDTIKEGW